MDLKTVKLNDIYRPDSFNCRGHINQVEVVDLARDIEKNGLIQPVLIAPNNCGTPHKYRLIAGYSRCLAHDLLERDEIPAVIRPTDISEMEAVLINLSENIQRKQLTLAQEAKVVEKLLEMQATEYQIVHALSVTRNWVQIRKMYVKLPDQVKPLIDQGFVTQAQIRTLYTVMNDHGLAATVDAAYRIKQAKQQGKHINIRPMKKKDPHKKKVRTRSEMFEMQAEIKQAKGNNEATKALAWAAGEISTKEFRDYAGLDNGEEANG